MIEANVETDALARLRLQLGAVPDLQIQENEPLARHTRFGIGGPASLLITAASDAGFTRALRAIQDSGCQWAVVGGGTNLVVSDSGFPGVVVKLKNNELQIEEDALGATITVGAGVVLQDLVDFSIDHGLHGLETMTGIPGWVGAAVYGNAGAYGHSISEWVSSVTFFDGNGTRTIGNSECNFRYRESVFKQQKQWIILRCELRLRTGDAVELRRTADEILRVRNQKYPPAMRCAGSIFKNFLLSELPATVQSQVPVSVIREGKVPSAWFLEQVGAKGMRRGDIQVASYHANLIYNDGQGTARDLVDLINTLKHAVNSRFDIPVEEEVQYVGSFNGNARD